MKSQNKKSNIYTRTRESSEKDIYANIGKIVTGKKEARTNNDEITIFDSTGLAIQDIAIANIIYKKATKSKKAKYISFM